MDDRRHLASMALPAKIPLKRNEGDRYEGILKQSDTETQQPCSRTYEFERFHAGKTAAPARRSDSRVAGDTKKDLQAADDSRNKRRADEAGLGMPSSSNGREGHDRTQQRQANQEGSDGPIPKRARVEAPGTPAEGGAGRVALPPPQIRALDSSSAAAQPPELRSDAAASEVDLQAAQQVVGSILLDCRESRGLSSPAARSEEAVRAEAAGSAGGEQGAAGGAAEGRPGSMGTGGQRRVGRTLKTARKTHALLRMAGAPKPKPKLGRKPGSAGKSAGSAPKAKARKPTQLALSRSKAGGEASAGNAAAEASGSQEAVAEVLNGPSPETIAQADLKYKLTTPHQMLPEEVERGQEVLKRYRARCAELKAEGQRKEDMRAFKEMKEELETPLQTVGHIPGFKAGDTFRCKGELAIVGIHCNIAGGIYFGQVNPCFAIVLSGGYKDDEDAGAEILYTGQGGQKDGRQVEDQAWAKGNMCLKISFEQAAPVRVCRGSGVEKTYDGLYRIIRAWREEGKDGFLICRFCMVPIPGHSHVSEKVLAKPEKVSRNQRAAHNVEEDSARVRRQVRTLAEAAKDRPGYICADISEGVEAVPIPVFNRRTDDAVPQLTYTRRNVIRTDAAREVNEEARQCFEHSTCGRMKMGNTAYVGSTGILKREYINCTSIYECVSTCTDRLCAQNKVVTQGITAPLEVFHTGGRGWGLRCARDLRQGEFVCEYAGEVITTTEAEQLDVEQDEDKYLYDMTDFSGKLKADRNPEFHQQPAPPVPPDREDPSKRTMLFLTNDARTKGNVGRFMNHSCSGGDVLGRTVLVEGDTGLLYTIGMFTHRFVPAGTELTYDYQWDMKRLEVACACGYKHCEGWKEGDVAPASPAAAATTAPYAAVMEEGAAAEHSAEPEVDGQPERPATEAQQLEEQAQPAEKAQDEDGMTPADVKE